MELIDKYFPELHVRTREKLAQLEGLYFHWNERINLISRKDMDSFYERHVLHSLTIAKLVAFQPGSKILDVGTGGGFPGIPLAILFPQCNFSLVDSTGKKIKVVKEVAAALSLANVEAIHGRVEHMKGRYEYVVSRAVTQMPRFISLTRERLNMDPQIMRDDYGIWYLKGGDLSAEMAEIHNYRVYELSRLFEEDFFATKKLIHLPAHSIQ